LPDYLRLGPGDKTDDLHPGMAFGTFKGINLPHFLDALPPCFRRSNLRDQVGSGAPIGKAPEPLIVEIVGKIIETGASRGMERAMGTCFAVMACHGAIRANSTLTPAAPTAVPPGWNGR